VISWCKDTQILSHREKNISGCTAIPSKQHIEKEDAPSGHPLSEKDINMVFATKPQGRVAATGMDSDRCYDLMPLIV
jgi:hypothetical protein